MSERKPPADMKPAMPEQVAVVIINDAQLHGNHRSQQQLMSGQCKKQKQPPEPEERRRQQGELSRIQDVTADITVEYMIRVEQDDEIGSFSIFEGLQEMRCSSSLNFQ